MTNDHERVFRPASSPPSTTPQNHAQTTPRHRVQNSASSRSGRGRGGFGRDTRINHRGQKQESSDRRQASSDYRQVNSDSRNTSSDPRKTSSDHRKASNNQ